MSRIEAPAKKILCLAALSMSGLPHKKTRHPERSGLSAGSDATKVGRVVGSSIDALTRRLLGFAVADLGEAPVPWAWLALGSEARLEQALHTDQDHALAYDPGDRSAEELDPYFAQLAERVTSGLESAGIPRCKGDAMAVHPGLRRSIDSWADAFRTWMSDPSLDGSILSSIAFDFRRVDGPLDVEPALHAVDGDGAASVSPVPPAPHASRARPQAAHGVHAELRRGVQG